MIIGGIITSSLLSSCNNDLVGDIGEQTGKEFLIEEQSDIIPLDSALATLNAFMDHSGTLKSSTRSCGGKATSSIDIHYSTETTTRAAAPKADAYIVNFEAEEGFAVLGATKDVAPIVAVTDKGSINPVDLSIELCDKPKTIIELDDGDYLEIEDPWYDEENDDFYVTGTDPSFISSCIATGLSTGSSQIGTVQSTSSTQKYYVRYPMLKTEWGQGDFGVKGVYNKYCYKTTILGKQKYVKAGCTTIAAAQIIAHNEFPNDLYVNGYKLDYKQLKLHRRASQYDPSQTTEPISQLIGLIYNFTWKIFKWPKGTLITPSEVQKILPKFGYTNVKMYKGSSIDDEMLHAISDMMNQRKPVFISAISGALDGHSWVISGTRYTGDYYMLHCDWGWHGDSNGYFSPTCFKPNSVYDFDWHFRVITYDIPTYSSSTCNFYY